MKPTAPRDSLGNEILVGNYVTLIMNRPIIFKVEAVESGGIATVQGVTPALVRVTCDITMRQLPGLPFGMLVRVVSPDSQKMVEDTSVTFPTA